MAIFPRPARPQALIADLKAFLRGQERHKILGAMIAIIMPTLILAGFYVDSKRDKRKPDIIYVQNYAPGRTDEEIKRQNIADQKILDAQREARRQQYQKVADQLGIK
ncbi:hypothetical protein [Rhizorhabdus dicambivorans]|uniref:Uncharacterized protein n=1 Tax=Rhizorhabdus dicambivorans TaxID=1850238 RepID=A0A2A4FSQ2_9SPHN|nr:hypothetical protein [Rhizorhabdus dicambivorans]ATE62986.1 hypothetical protein CMV14_00045 [Rhizorhabdus dicambivorans]PCE40478.1 hypothetical protein COO09_19910 [Rhizorhabdus dicambivorans]